MSRHIFMAATDARTISLPVRHGVQSFLPECTAVPNYCPHETSRDLRDLCGPRGERGKRSITPLDQNTDPPCSLPSACSERFVLVLAFIIPCSTPRIAKCEGRPRSQLRSKAPETVTTAIVLKHSSDV